MCLFFFHNNPLVLLNEKPRAIVWINTYFVGVFVGMLVGWFTWLTNLLIVCVVLSLNPSFGLHTSILRFLMKLSQWFIGVDSFIVIHTFRLIVWFLFIRYHEWKSTNLGPFLSISLRSRFFALSISFHRFVFHFCTFFLFCLLDVFISVFWCLGFID